MARLLLPVLVLLIATCFLVWAVQAGDEGLRPEGEVNAFRHHVKSGYCGSKCDYRCSKANLHKRCLKYCNICCAKCRCVPPGTAGNRETCPCYNNIMNSRGGHKCP